MLRIFWGPDNFTRGEAVARLKTELDSDGMLSANTTILDGAHLDFDALIAACDTVPFLAEHRLVIVENLLAQGESRPARRRPPRRGAAATDAQPTAIERLAAYAATMPPSTILLLLEGDIRRDGAALAALSTAGEATYFPRKGGQDLRAWVSERAKASGAALDPAAQALLIESTGGELWLIAQEIEKLALYAGGAGRQRLCDGRRDCGRENPDRACPTGTAARGRLRRALSAHHDHQAVPAADHRGGPAEPR